MNAARSGSSSSTREAATTSGQAPKGMIDRRSITPASASSRACLWTSIAAAPDPPRSQVKIGKAQIAFGQAPFIGVKVENLLETRGIHCRIAVCTRHDKGGCQGRAAKAAKEYTLIICERFNGAGDENAVEHFFPVRAALLETRPACRVGVDDRDLLAAISIDPLGFADFRQQGFAHCPETDQKRVLDTALMEHEQRIGTKHCARRAPAFRDDFDNAVELAAIGRAARIVMLVEGVIEFLAMLEPVIIKENENVRAHALMGSRRPAVCAGGGFAETVHLEHLPRQAGTFGIVMRGKDQRAGAVGGRQAQHLVNPDIAVERQDPVAHQFLAARREMDHLQPRPDGLLGRTGGQIHDHRQ